MTITQATDVLTKPFNWIYMGVIVVSIVLICWGYYSLWLAMKFEQDGAWHKQYKLLRAVDVIVSGSISLIIFSALIVVRNSALSISLQVNIEEYILTIYIAIVWLLLMPLGAIAWTIKKSKR